jgi:hypothetical protein
VVKSEGKSPLRRPRCGWAENIKIDPREKGLDGMEWIPLAKDRGRWMVLLNMVTNVRVL